MRWSISALCTRPCWAKRRRSLLLYHQTCSLLSWTLMERQEQICQLVTTWWKGRLLDSFLKPKQVVTVNWKHLVEAPVHEIFISLPPRDFCKAWRKVGYIVSTWCHCRYRSCGQKVVGAFCRNYQNTNCWTPVVMEAEEGRGLGCPEDFWSRMVRWIAASMIAETKVQVWEEFRAAINKYFHLSSKRSWQTLWWPEKERRSFHRMC